MIFEKSNFIFQVTFITNKTLKKKNSFGKFMALNNNYVFNVGGTSNFYYFFDKLN